MGLNWKNKTGKHKQVPARMCPCVVQEAMASSLLGAGSHASRLLGATHSPAYFFLCFPCVLDMNKMDRVHCRLTQPHKQCVNRNVYTGMSSFISKSGITEHCFSTFCSYCFYILNCVVNHRLSPMDVPSPTHAVHMKEGLWACAWEQSCWMR